MKEKKRHYIPAKASKFSWMYPKSELRHDTLKNYSNKNVITKWLNNPSITAFIIGGFAYFDENNHLLKVNTLIPNSKKGLKFCKPKKWQHKFSSKLIKQNRFHCITIEKLRECGARYFCWLFPCEEVFDGEGNCFINGEHGSFLYIFHEPEEYKNSYLMSYDRYFDVF